MGFQQGLSGLNVASKNMDVIGNNVANASTVGFKSGQAQFSDVFAASLSGAGTSPVGLGAKTVGVLQQFTQGNVTTTNNPLDIAINGGGFFVVSPAGTNTPYYSRNGQFSQDSTDHIVNNEGLRVQGYAVNAAGVVLVGSTPTDLQVSKAKISPLMTGTAPTSPGVHANVNLDARDSPITAPFDYSNPSSYNRSTALSIYDSQGNAHTYTTFFQKTAVNTWNVYTKVDNPTGASPTFTDLSNSVVGNAAFAAITTTATAAVTAAAAAAAPVALTAADVSTAIAGASAAITTAADAAVVTAGGVTGSVAGAGAAATAAAAAAALLPGATAASVVDAVTAAAAVTARTLMPAVATLSFSPAGVLASLPSTQTITSAQLGYGAAGVSDMTNIPIDFTGSTQYGSTFSVNTLAQDGYASGELAGFNVGADGVIKGRYTNGQTKNLGQVALANFSNPQGLQPQGNNRWAVTSASGVALINPPGSGGNGVLQSAAVEDSNVDLTAELVNMITAQRVYQANAQTIKTQDAMLQTLVNLR